MAAKRTKRTPKKGARSCKAKAGRKRSKPDWKPLFLAALAQTGNIMAACRAADIGRTAFYQHRDSDPAFAAAVRGAYRDAADVLELESRRRAHDGYDEPVIHKGELMGVWVDADGKVATKDTPGAKLIPLTVRKFSDTLLIFLMKGANPRKYRENVRLDHKVKGSMKLQIVEEIIGADGSASSGQQDDPPASAAGGISA